MRPLRSDLYFSTPMHYGVQHFGKPMTSEIVKDTVYLFLPLYWNAGIISLKLNAPALASASVNVFAYKRIVLGEPLKIFEMYLAKSIATAVADTELTLNAGFADYKPSKFTMLDCLRMQPTIAPTIKTDQGFFDLLELGFSITGADVPDDFKMDISYTYAYLG